MRNVDLGSTVSLSIGLCLGSTVSRSISLCLGPTVSLSIGLCLGPPVSLSIGLRLGSTVSRSIGLNFNLAERRRLDLDGSSHFDQSRQHSECRALALALRFRRSKVERVDHLQSRIVASAAKCMLTMVETGDKTYTPQAPTATRGR